MTSLTPNSIQSCKALQVEKAFLSPLMQTKREMDQCQPRPFYSQCKTQSCCLHPSRAPPHLRNNHCQKWYYYIIINYSHAFTPICGDLSQSGVSNSLQSGWAVASYSWGCWL